MPHRRTINLLAWSLALIVPAILFGFFAAVPIPPPAKVVALLFSGSALAWTSLRAASWLSKRLADAVEKAAETTEATQREVISVADGFTQLTELQEQIDRRFEQQKQMHARAERDLGTSTSLLQTAYAALADAVLVVDSSNRLVLQNPASDTLLGLRSNHLNRPLFESLRVPQLHDLLAKATETGETCSGRIDLTRIDRIATAVVSPLPDPPGGAVLVIQDETELRRLERMRRDFVSNVSHELKTPLTSIQAYADTLRDGALDDREMAEAFLDRIIGQANRLNAMIVDMLDLARLESDRTLTQPMPYSATSFAMQAIANHLPVAATREVSLTTEVQSGAFLAADRATLQTIVDNLVKNAIEHSSAGGSVQLSIDDYIPQEHREHYAARSNRDSATIEDGRIPLICIHVQDTGTGIPRDHLDRIFERFFRVDRSRNREIGGSGLGLAIVKHATERVGGFVSVESKVGVGSTFHATVPGSIEPRDGSETPADT